MEYNYVPGGDMLFTADNSGLANATNFVGSDDRFYSVSVTGTTVPEPSTWMMMIFGVGGLGFAARASRRTTAVAA